MQIVWRPSFIDHPPRPFQVLYGRRGTILVRPDVLGAIRGVDKRPQEPPHKVWLGDVVEGGRHYAGGMVKSIHLHH